MPPLSAAVIVLAIAAAPLAVLAALRWRRALVMALPFLAVLNGVAVPVGASSVRLDQLAACLLVVPLVAQVLIGARRARTDATAWWLAAILALNVVASVLHSPARSYSLLQCVNLATVWVIHVLLLNFLDTRDEIDAFFRRLLWAGLAASAIGIGAFVVAIAGFPLGGAEVSRAAAERLTMAFGAYGTMVEPNILGSFTAAHLVLAATLLVVAAQHPTLASGVRLLRWLAVASAVALALTFTRAAWLAALAGLAFCAATGVRALGLRLRAARVAGPTLLVLACLAALPLLPGSVGMFFRFKVVNLLNVESRTALLRLMTYVLGLEQTLEHPILGWGTFTFAPLVAQGSDFQRYENWRSLWIGNYLLLALHDTGVVGLALWAGMLWSLVARGTRAARLLRSIDPMLAGRTLGLTGAVVSLLVAFLSTTGFSLAYPWLLSGLLAAHSRLAAGAAETATEAATRQPTTPLAPPHPVDAT